MTIGNIKRFIKSGAPLALLLALALVLVPVGASADELSVCNTAGQGGQGGQMVVTNDPQGALHYSDNLKAMGNRNFNAASHSRALATCYVPGNDDGGVAGGIATT